MKVAAIIHVQAEPSGLAASSAHPCRASAAATEAAIQRVEMILTLAESAKKRRRRFFGGWIKPQCSTEARKPKPLQYSGAPPGGRVFHLRCTHNHCSGYFLTYSSMIEVNFCVLALISAPKPPVRIRSTAGSKRNRYFPSSASQMVNVGTTA